MQLSQIINSKRNPVRIKKASLGKSLSVREIGKILSERYEEHVAIDTREPTIIENMIVSSNNRGSFRIRIREYTENGIIPYGELSYDGEGSLGLTPENMMDHGSSYFDFVEYDLSHSRYKLVLKKPMTFPEGVTISFINDYTEEINYSSIIVGRYYD